MLYQKDNITIEPAIDTVEGETYYSFHVVKKSLPRASNIVYAEDLLNFDSQEYLAAVFGSQNIKQDIFHYSQKETNRCTVLFPHTNREAIFIWNDEDNMRDLAFVIIGPGLDKIEETNGFVKIPHNTWWSKQGIYCGMSMKDVEHINQEEIKIYNWNTEAGGYLAPGNKGVIDFKRIGMIFNCWNCAIAKQESSHVISSGFFSNEYSKVFISTLIILPDKRSQTSSLSK